MKAAGSTEVGQITLLLKVNPRDKTTSIQHRATEGNCCSFHCLLQTAPTPPKHHTGHVQNTLMALCLHTATYPAPVVLSISSEGSTLQAGQRSRRNLKPQPLLHSAPTQISGCFPESYPRRIQKQRAQVSTSKQKGEAGTP